MPIYLIGVGVAGLSAYLMGDGLEKTTESLIKIAVIGAAAFVAYEVVKG